MQVSALSTASPTPLLARFRLGSIPASNLSLRIRHKKCDETRPACIQCQSAGYRCDFLTSKPSPGLPSHSALTGLGATLWEYFRVVCAKEFSLLFNCSSWESLVLRLALLEPFAFHAALSISALSRTHYAQRVVSPPGATSIFQYAAIQYSMAIQKLNARLNETTEGAELAILGSILFINVEFLLADTEPSRNFMRVHLLGGVSTLMNIQHTKSLRFSQEWEYLQNALLEMSIQMNDLSLASRLQQI